MHASYVAMGAKPRKYAEPSFCLFVFSTSFFFSILLILWLHHQVPVKSGMKGYKNKAAVYAFEDLHATLT